jgi:dipeptidyl aminopeptidase/acylaminoacyl peptidase
MRRSLALALVLGVIGGGCAGDDEPRPSGEKRHTSSTVPLAADLLTEVKGWKLAFLWKRRTDKHPSLFVANADGSALRRVDKLRGDKQTPNWSPDGRRIAFRWVPYDYERTTPLMIIDADGSDLVNLTEITGLAGWSPTWSPDGTRIAVAASEKAGEPPNLYVMDSTGANVKRLTDPDREAQYASWSPDGRRIAFTFVESGGFDLYSIRPDGSGLRRLTNDGASGENNWAMWSPDSKRIAWGCGDSLCVMDADGSNKRLVTDAGGVPAAWAPGPYITFGCPGEEHLSLCAIRPDGSGLTQLLGGIEAGFPGWKPRA